MDELKGHWHRLDREHASCRVQSLVPWGFRVIACRPARTSALCALLHGAGEPRGTISRMMGAADEGTGSHVLADHVRQDLSCPRPRHRREGLFGVYRRRRTSAPAQCLYHTHPCEFAPLAKGHCSVMSEKTATT